MQAPDMQKSMAPAADPGIPNPTINVRAGGDMFDDMAHEAERHDAIMEGRKPPKHKIARRPNPLILEEQPNQQPSHQLAAQPASQLVAELPPEPKYLVAWLDSDAGMIRCPLVTMAELPGMLQRVEQNGKTGNTPPVVIEIRGKAKEIRARIRMAPVVDFLGDPDEKDEP
jgi:hypothetical protein